MDAGVAEKLRRMSKVELHVHLDGAVSPETIFDLAKQRGISLAAPSAHALREEIALSLEDPADLKQLLSKFQLFLPVIAGDGPAVRRVAQEWCEEAGRAGVVYAEVRFSPHVLASSLPQPEYCSPGNLTPRQVVKLVCEGLAEGEAAVRSAICPHFMVRSILASMRHRPEWTGEVVSLAEEARTEGVVGVDLAGDESLASPTHPDHITAFTRAEALGLYRTVHAGENGTAANVQEAVDILHAQRVGHGYHALDDVALYRRLVARGVHFEMCPVSSVVTGSVTGSLTQHPLKNFLEDGASVSINTDDPIITGHSLIQEYGFVHQKLGLSIDLIQRANINAAKAAFLPEAEKQQLVNRLEAEYYGK